MNPVYRIYLAGFLLDGALMVGLTALPFFVYHHLGGSATLTGGIGSAQSLIYAAVCLASSLFVGHVRNGIRLSVAGALIFGGLFSFSHLSSNVWLYAAGASLSTAGMSLVWPALQNWLGAEPNPARRTRLLGGFHISWSLGLALGPLLGGALYELDYRLPFLAVLAMSAGAAWLLFWVPPETTQAHDPETPTLSRTERVAFERLIVAAWVANGLCWALVGVTRMVFPKQMDELVEANALRLLFESQPPALLGYGAAGVYGFMAFLLSFSSCAMFFLFGRTHWWQGRFSLLIALQLGAAASVWTLGGTHSLVVMALCFTIIGANCGACFFAATFYCTVNPVKKHRRLAINEAVVGLGGFIAPFGFGYLADQYGIETSFRYAPVFVLALVLTQVILLVRARMMPVPARSV
jgi:MFS family permease